MVVGSWLAAADRAAAAVVIIVIKNKDGSQTKIKVPDGATVTIKEKDGKRGPLARKSAWGGGTSARSRIRPGPPGGGVRFSRGSPL